MGFCEKSVNVVGSLGFGFLDVSPKTPQGTDLSGLFSTSSSAFLGMSVTCIEASQVRVQTVLQEAPQR